MKQPLIYVAALLASASLVGAEPPIMTDRPDQSDSPFVVPSGLFQIEGGGFYGQRDQENQELTVQASPLALFRFGVTDPFELRLGAPGIAIETTDAVTGKTIHARSLIGRSPPASLPARSSACSENFSA